MSVWRRVSGHGASRTLLHSPDTCTSNTSNTFLQRNRSPVLTLRAPWTGSFFRMQTTTRIMLYWYTASHTLRDPERMKVDELRQRLRPIHVQSSFPEYLPNTTI